LADFPIKPQKFTNLLVLDCCFLRGLKSFDDPIDFFDLIINNIEANAKGAKVSGYGQVWIRRLEVPAGMVVDDDISGAAGLEDCGNRIAISASKDLKIDNNLF
jgi:hypothetical protein